MSTPPLHPSVRRAVSVLLAGWVGVLLVTLLGPSAEGPSWLVETVAAAADRLRVPAALAAPERIEFVLNMCAFVPVSLLGRVLWPGSTWRDWTAGGFVASFLVEVVQALFLDLRSATHVDVVSNTLGALVGAVLGAVLVRLLAQRASEGRADLAHGTSPTQEDELPG
jgi:hypothetical protein